MDSVENYYILRNPSSTARDSCIGTSIWVLNLLDYAVIVRATVSGKSRCAPLVEFILDGKSETEVNLPAEAPQRVVMIVTRMFLERDLGVCNTRRGGQLLICELNEATRMVLRDK